jgi:hypothetical protein
VTGNGKVVTVECLNSQGLSVGAADDSEPFTITSSDLVLLNPGRGVRAVNGGAVRVAWKKSTAGTVNIFVKAGASGPETLVQANVSGTFKDITLPAAVSNSSQVTIRIEDSGNSANGDSVDGFFMVRGATPSFTTGLADQTLQIGSILPLEWNGPSSSYIVDLDLYENGAFSRSIIKNLPDFGNYTWFVPESWSPHSAIRATFKDFNNAPVAVADSAAFKVFYSTIPGSAVNRYRLYSPITLEHLFTTDLNEYNVLGQTGIWIQEGPASKMFDGPVNIGGVEGVPYYRLYDLVALRHHWTTDRNEYFTLRRSSSRYAAEGVDGYIFLTQVAGSVPWFRLAYPLVPGLHHWTSDVNERNVLVSRGWVEEAKEYVIP